MMSKSRRLSLLLALLLVLLLSLVHSLLAAAAAVGEDQGAPGVLGSKGSDIQPVPNTPPRRKLRGRFLHITDLHPDELYRPYTDDNDEACHRGVGPAGVYGTELSGCDSPISLVNATFDWIAANLADDIDFVVWTGDSARHNNDEQIPRSAAEVVRTNQLLADKMVDTFSDGPREGSADGGRPRRMAVPVVPNIGNNDFLPHNILLPGPNNKWLDKYADVWAPFIPPAQRGEFQFGGWFSVEVVPGHLAVLSLNTMYFFDKNAGVDDCAAPSQPGFKQMEWLRIQLQQLRERGAKAVLIGHVPPAKTDSKQLWDDTCYQKYNLWLRQYRDVVVGSVYGHMNMDHFVLHDTKGIDLRLIGGEGQSYNDDGDMYIEEDEDEDGDGDDEEDEDEEDDKDEAQEEEVQAEEGEAAEDDEEPWQSVSSDELRKRDVSGMASGKGKYLLELRDFWANLPPVDPLCKGVAPENPFRSGGPPGSSKKREKKRRRKALKRLGGKWAERFHVSLIAPSVVPNFFPTLRVIEYNITGLEDADTWEPPADPGLSTDGAEDLAAALGELEGEIRRAKAAKKEAKRLRKAEGGKKKKKKKNGHGSVSSSRKKKGDREQNLVIPEPPSESAPPGPAYSPQPLTFTGYTQYFANLTRINNGGGRGKRPEPAEFRYEVEYSTFKDKVLKLADLTVRHYVRLAYRIGMAEADRRGAGAGGDVNEAETGYQDVECEEVEALNLGKKKRERRKKASERTWQHFVGYAFVSTGYEKENMERVRHAGDDE